MLESEKSDGIPAIEVSNSGQNNKQQYSTSKYLMNYEDEEDKLSNISEMFEK